jgi:hypothetical protein
MNTKSHMALCALVLGLAASGSQTSASIIEQATLNFESGATWVGTISFYDGYEGMFDTDGYLNGGSHNFNNVHYSWTWWEGSGQPNPNAYSNPPLYNDWLMDGGSYSQGYTTYIGLSWNAALSTLNGGIIFAPLTDPFVNGNQLYNDLIIGYSIGNRSTPEVGTTACLLGLAMAGILAVRRRLS